MGGRHDDDGGVRRRDAGAPRILGVVPMLAGLGLVATLSTSIAGYFVRQDVEEVEEKEELDTKALGQRLGRIEALLKSMSHPRSVDPVSRPRGVDED